MNSLKISRNEICIVLIILVLFCIFIFFCNPDKKENFDGNTGNKCDAYKNEEMCNKGKGLADDCVWTGGKCQKDNRDFKAEKENLKIQRVFCKELKKLNKSKNYNDNMNFKLLTDFIEEKKMYISKLETRIEKLLKHMHEEEIYKYNINKIREHDQAKKQIEAIKKGIENIENKNKIVLNLE